MVLWKLYYLPMELLKNDIIFEYAGKNKLDIKPIQNILNKDTYTGKNTGE